MKLNHNDLEHIKDMLNLGKITVDQANVEKVKCMRVQLVISRLPANVRKALNEAVKRGELGHMKKDGNKPEAYYHPTFEYLAKSERNEHERNVFNAILNVCC